MICCVAAGLYNAVFVTSVLHAQVVRCKFTDLDEAAVHSVFRFERCSRYTSWFAYCRVFLGTLLTNSTTAQPYLNKSTNCKHQQCQSFAVHLYVMHTPGYIGNSSDDCPQLFTVCSAGLAQQMCCKAWDCRGMSTES